MIKKRNLDPSLLQWIQSQAGIGPMLGNVKYLTPAASSSSQFRTTLQGLGVSDGDMFTTLVAAEAALTDYNHDVLVVAPGWFEEIATTTWDLYDSHILGSSMTPNQSRTDIVQTTNSFSPMMTISGRGNSFANLTFRHGVGSTDYVGLLVSGRYNYFENVYWMTPMVQAQADHTSYIGVNVTGHGNYFRNCHFGSDGMARGAKNYSISVAGRGNVFEDCVFSMLADATSPHFINLNTADDSRYNLFKNCTFFVHYVNHTDQIALAVDVTGAMSTGNLIFDSRCMFVGVDALCASADERFCWVPQTWTTSDLTLGLIGIAYDAD